MWISLMEFEKKLPFKVRPHNRKQLSLQCKMIGAPSFFTTLLVDATTPTIPTNNPFLYCSQFPPPYITSPLHILPHYPYNPHQHSLPIYLSHFSPPYFYTQPSLQSLPKVLSPTSTIQPIQVESKAQWTNGSCVDRHCFNLSLPPRSMGRDNSTHNHWFLIGHTQ